MSRDDARKEEARTTITIACQLLAHSRRVAPATLQVLCDLGEDCDVLPDEATRLFGQTVSVK